MEKKDLKPAGVFHYFEEICQVPRPSKKEEKIIAFLKAFGEKHKLETKVDEAGNVLIKKPATPGMENRKTVVLQSHVDMVCEKNNDVKHDFLTDPIETEIDGEWLKAKGTTLGADNGIGVAAGLAVATSDVPHGPLRCLFTADEDVGLHGAAALDPAALDSEFLINIDLEEENEVCYSCAGNLRASMKQKFATKPVCECRRVFRLTVDKLLGGHSGMDIHRNRLNASVALMTMLDRVQTACGKIRFVEVKSGAAFNAITHNGSATFAVKAEMEAQMREAIAATQAELAEKFPLEKMTVELTQVDAEGLEAISGEDSANLIALVNYLPQGVLAMSPKIEGLVQTSSNTGILQLVNGNCEVGTSSRSCVTADVDKLEDDFRKESGKYGYELTVMSKYPGWDGDPDTPLLKLAAQGYKSIGVDARLVAIHAGLEPSWFSSKREGMQMICLGPTIKGAHTTEETLYIDTLAPTMDVVLYCLHHVNEL